MNTRGAAAVVAGLLLIVGFALSISVVSIDFSGPINCGSAVAPDRSTLDAGTPSGEAEVFDSIRARCDEALSGRRAVAFPVAGVGALGLVFIGLTAFQRRQATAPAPPVQ